ncbi:hypothetical protein BDQ17DRAFT_628419 [Cyathus striatus]|nr:hypothetical protein BDQ17DRAFT_628419 [Cyathus striatus]
MAKSRHILFQRMEFDYDKSAFDGFLDVLDAPWTSFSAVVQHISIKRFFRGASKLENRFAYVPRSAASIRRITQNLPNLERLWVVRSSWGDFPPHILDLLFHLPVSDLQIEECSIQHISELQELFIRMPPSIRTISMYNMRESYSLRRDGYVTQDVIPFPDRNIHFETIDSVSAYFVMQLWSDLLGKGWKRSISVDTFHLRMYTSTDVSHSDIATCSRFLQIVGPSIRRLCIRLSEGSSWDRDFFTSGVDMSPCVNVSFIDIDKIQLDAGEMADICSRPNVEHLLSSVPPNQVEEMLVTFYFADYFNRIPLDDQIPYLRAFGWKTFICHLRCRFKNLRRLRIRLSGGLVKNEHGLADICLYVNVLREISELDQLERSAFLSFEGVPPTSSYLRYRDTMGGILERASRLIFLTLRQPG